MQGTSELDIYAQTHVSPHIMAGRCSKLCVMQGTSELNIYAQTHALAHIMADIEAHDKLEGRGPVPVPAWIRAHFRSVCFGTCVTIVTG